MQEGALEAGWLGIEQNVRLSRKFGHFVAVFQAEAHRRVISAGNQRHIVVRCTSARMGKLVSRAIESQSALRRFVLEPGRVFLRGRCPAQQWHFGGDFRAMRVQFVHRLEKDRVGQVLRPYVGGRQKRRSQR